MDRKLIETRSPKIERITKRVSAFEMITHLEFELDLPWKGTAIPKAGETCRNCQSAKIDYDGMLNLSCPDCGYILVGCFT